MTTHSLCWEEQVCEVLCVVLTNNICSRLQGKLQLLCRDDLWAMCSHAASSQSSSQCAALGLLETPVLARWFSWSLKDLTYNQGLRCCQCRCTSRTGLTGQAGTGRMRPQSKWVSAELQRRPCWGKHSSFITSFSTLSPKVQLFPTSFFFWNLE